MFVRACELGERTLEIPDLGIWYGKFDLVPWLVGLLYIELIPDKDEGLVDTIFVAVLFIKFCVLRELDEEMGPELIFWNWLELTELGDDKAEV